MLKKKLKNTYPLLKTYIISCWWKLRIHNISVPYQFPPHQNFNWWIPGENKSVVQKMFTFLMTLLTYMKTFVICSQNLIKIMIDCPIQHLVSIDETQIACKSDLCEINAVLCLRSFVLSFIKRGRSLVVFQLFIEKLNGEAKHKFFRYGIWIV